MLSCLHFKKSKDATTSRTMQTPTPSPTIKLLEAPDSHVHTDPMPANIINRAPPLLAIEEPIITTEVLLQDRDHEEDDDEHIDDVVMEAENHVCWGTYGRRTVLKFPPPITHLAITCNKMNCQLPWVWERSYKDGRLVIRQVPVVQHEYMQAQRKNGRLTLQLVQKNDYLEEFMKRMELQEEYSEDQEKDQNSVVESCEDHKSTEEEVKKVIQVKTMDENYCSSSIDQIMPKTETVLVECQALCA